LFFLSAIVSALFPHVHVSVIGSNLKNMHHKKMTLDNRPILEKASDMR
jgi:hypothetical protein